MFCGCTNDPHVGEPNIYICPVCTAHPGTLPVVNRAAVEKVRMVGVAIGGTLADFSEFDRKNYFYPDIPKAYQISQYAHPLVSGGELAGVAITRIHLEEDTARSQHHQGIGSLVDFNRAGVPLMELVTEPVIHSAAHAGQFARELQLLFRTLGVSNANMEKGEMRVEANISVSNTDVFGTKVEVKNLNSFKAMEAAIDYEVVRQIDVLKSGASVVQETRGWDEVKGKTFSQRSKESANDYRYFPDPDIPKYQLSLVEDMTISRLSEKIPILPNKIRDSYRDLGITEEHIETILFNSALQSFFWSVIAELTNASTKEVQLAANYVVTDVASALQKNDSTLDPRAPVAFAALIELIANETINSRTAKDLLPEVLFSGIDPKSVAKERGLTQQNSSDALLPLVTQVLEENPDVAAEYAAGKETALKYLVGQGMKLSKGTANPQLLEKLLKENIA